jgi:hypothetical protein
MIDLLPFIFRLLCFVVRQHQAKIGEVGFIGQI